MCLIIYIPKGIKKDASIIEKAVKNAFESGNKDGIGLGVYRYKSKTLYMHKSWSLTPTSFMKVFNDLNLNKNDTCVIHLRNGNVGSLTTQMTHPFLVTESESELLSMHSGIVNKPILVHNGTFYRYNSNKHSGNSDTAEFILQLFAIPEITSLFKRIENKAKTIFDSYLGTNKLIVIYPDGHVFKTGDFTEDNGIFYSNDSYKDSSKGDCGGHSCYPVEHDFRDNLTKLSEYWTKKYTESPKSYKESTTRHDSGFRIGNESADNLDAVAMFIILRNAIRNGIIKNCRISAEEVRNRRDDLEFNRYICYVKKSFFSLYNHCIQDKDLFEIETNYAKVHFVYLKPWIAKANIPHLRNHYTSDVALETLGTFDKDQFIEEHFDIYEKHHVRTVMEGFVLLFRECTCSKNALKRLAKAKPNKTGFVKFTKALDKRGNSTLERYIHIDAVRMFLYFCNDEKHAEELKPELINIRNDDSKTKEEVIDEESGYTEIVYEGG